MVCSGAHIGFGRDCSDSTSGVFDLFAFCFVPISLSVNNLPPVEKIVFCCCRERPWNSRSQGTGALLWQFKVLAGPELGRSSQLHAPTVLPSHDDDNAPLVRTFLLQPSDVP